jgi:hypothetical protein
MEIIIRGKTKFGRSRSEREDNIRKEWGRTMTDEQLDKVKFLEKKSKEIIGAETTNFTPSDADKIK